MIDKTKPISIRLAKGEIDQLQARAHSCRETSRALPEI